MPEIKFKPVDFIWEAKVRHYELDLQGIINNAVYLQFFDNARVEYMHYKGLDWSEFVKNGLDIVVSHIDISFKASLKIYDSFYIVASIAKVGKLKLLFKQRLYNKNSDKLTAEAISTIVCISRARNRPVFPEQLQILL